MPAADPLLFKAGIWLGAASGLLALATLAGFLLRWGVRFRLVGVTSFTALLSLSCLAFAVSYAPRTLVNGAVVVPVVYDNGAELVVAAAPADLTPEVARASAEQVARNLRGGGRRSPDGLVHVRLRHIEAAADGTARPVVVAEATRALNGGAVTVLP